MAVDDEKKTELIKKYTGKDTSDLVKAYFKLKAERAKADAKVEVLKSEGVILTNILIAQFKIDNVSKVGVEKVGTVSMGNKNIFSIPSENKDEVFASFKKSKNLKGLVKPTVNYQSLQSTMKEYLERTNKLPKGVVMNTIDVLTYTKAKK